MLFKPAYQYTCSFICLHVTSVVSILHTNEKKSWPCFRWLHNLVFNGSWALEKLTTWWLISCVSSLLLWPQLLQSRKLKQLSPRSVLTDWLNSEFSLLSHKIMWSTLNPPPMSWIWKHSHPLCCVSVTSLWFSASDFLFLKTNRFRFLFLLSFYLDLMS